ncbi:MAG: hypothetical protein AAGB12_12415 [Pseudomonadota bacterium]
MKFKKFLLFSYLVIGVATSAIFANLAFANSDAGQQQLVINFKSAADSAPGHTFYVDYKIEACETAAQQSCGYIDRGEHFSSQNGKSLYVFYPFVDPGSGVTYSVPVAFIMTLMVVDAEPSAYPFTDPTGQCNTKQNIMSFMNGNDNATITFKLDTEENDFFCMITDISN